MRARTFISLVVSALLFGSGAWAQGHGRGHNFRGAAPRGWSQMSAPRTFRPAPMGRNFAFQGRSWHFAPHGPTFFPRSNFPFPGSQGPFLSPSGGQFFFSSSFFFPRHRFFFSPFSFHQFGFPSYSAYPPYFAPPYAYAPYSPYGGGYSGYSGGYAPAEREQPSPEAAPESKAPEPPASLHGDAESRAAERLTPRDMLLTLDGQEQPPPSDGGPVTLGSGRHTLRIAAKPAPVSR